MRAAIGHGTRSHHTAQHDPSAPLSGDGRSSSCARASHTGTRGRPRRRPSRCMRPGRGSRRAHAAARGPSRPPFAHRFASASGIRAQCPRRAVRVVVRRSSRRRLPAAPSGAPLRRRKPRAARLRSHASAALLTTREERVAEVARRALLRRDTGWRSVRVSVCARACARMHTFYVIDGYQAML